jgi:hypothetical protein
MQSIPTKFPFTRVYFGSQPFGVRVRCTLVPSLIKKRAHITGLAIEATGAMENYFGFGPFGRNYIKELGQTLGNQLSALDRDGGTTIIYWGTNDTTSIQSIGFYPAEQWTNSSFKPPANGYGRKHIIQEAIRYFLEGKFLTTRLIKSDLSIPGIFVFVLNGPVDDFTTILDYLNKVGEAAMAHRRKLDHLVFVGVGEHILENIQGQIQAFAAASGCTSPSLITSLIVHRFEDISLFVEEAVMAFVTTDKPGAIFEVRGKEICNFPSGLPGTFQFYLSGGATSFLLDLDGIIYKQELV